MATVCYASTGSNTAPYETWAKAATSLATALAACSSGDTMQFDMANVASGDAEVAGTTSWTVPSGVTVHIGTQNGASGITTGIMGSTYWIGNSTTGRSINFSAATGGAKVRIIGGLTLRTGGGAGITYSNGNASSVHADEVYLWNSSTTSSTLAIGAQEVNNFIGKLTLRQDDTTPTGGIFNIGGRIEVGYLDVVYAGDITVGLIDSASGEPVLRVFGGDISSIGSGNPICNDFTSGNAEIFLNNCILNASFVLMASQTNASPAGATIVVRDCSSSGSAVPYAYANSCGELRIDTGIYVTAAGAGRTWKLTTTANASATNPFMTPWFREYKAAATIEATSEVLRDGSATAYTDAELWKETIGKQTTSSVETTLDSTRGTGTNIPAGVGTGSWTGEGGTAWSGEVTIGSKVLDEDGYHLSRFGFAAASSTVYCDIGPVA